MDEAVEKASRFEHVFPNRGFLFVPARAFVDCVVARHSSEDFEASVDEINCSFNSVS